MWLLSPTSLQEVRDAQGYDRLYKIAALGVKSGILDCGLTLACIGLWEAKGWGSLVEEAEDLTWKVMLVSGVVAAPLFEEFMFRVVAYEASKAALVRLFVLVEEDEAKRTAYAANGATLLNGFLFAAMHGEGVAQIITCFVTGITYCSMRQATGSMVPGLISHMTFNGFLCACEAVESLLKQR